MSLETVSSELTPEQQTLFEALLQKLNPEQQAAVVAGIDENVCVMAGAGTGKTTLLSTRVAKLVLEQLAEGVPLDKALSGLWVATFSEKAAAALEKAIYKQLAYLLGDDAVYKGQDHARRPWIGTIHGLCMRLLVQSRLQQGVKAPVVVQNDIEKLLFQDALLAKLQSYSATELCELLTVDASTIAPAQELNQLLSPAYWADLGILDLSSMVQLIVEKLIPKIKAAGVTPMQFFQLAQQQSQQVTQLLAQLPQGHPLGSQALLTPFTDLEDAAKTWLAHLETIKDATFTFFPDDKAELIEALKASRRKNTTPKKTHQLLKENMDSFLKPKCFVQYDGRKKQFEAASQDLSAIEQPFKVEQKLIALVALVYQLYQASLVFEGVYDYDDLILEVIKAYQPEHKTLWRPPLFVHVLVDEFQDTNGAQLALIDLLRADTACITVVGDTKQSIYGFRYAQPENLNSVFRSHEQVKTIHLKTNYRSQPQLLKAANRATELLGMGDEHWLEPSASQTSLQQQWQMPQFFDLTAFSLSQAEAQELSIITETMQQKLQPTMQSDPQYQPNDIAILVPNHRKAEEIQQALAAVGIPAIRQKVLGFFKAPLFQGLAALLQWLFDTSNNMAFMGIVQQQVPPVELIAFAQQYRVYKTQFAEQSVSLLEDENTEASSVLSMSDWFYQLPEDQQQQFPVLKQTCHWLAQLLPVAKKAYPDEIIDKIIAEGFIDYLFKEDQLDNQQESLELFQQVLGQWATGGASQFTTSLNYGAEELLKPERKPVTTVLACLRYAQQLNQLESPWADIENTELNAVRILTLHAAKGLEFPVVFYAGVEAHRFRSDDGLLTFEPQCHPKSGFGLVLNHWQGQASLKSIWCKQLWQKPRQEQDKLRLMYVALTRAQQELFVTVGQKSFAYWQPQFFTNVVQHTIVAQPPIEETAAV